MADYKKMNAGMATLQFPQALIRRVNADYTPEGCKDRKVHTAFLRHACDTLDKALAAGEVTFAMYRDLMDANACCKTGRRDRETKALGRAMAGKPLAEQLKALQDAQNMMAPRLDAEGAIVVEMHCTNGKGFYCSCGNIHIPKSEARLSRHYCMCCAGHFRYHYQNALGIKLALIEIVSSPLDSMGKAPFVARFEIVP